MKLRINAKLRAAVIAAITAVGFTLTQASGTTLDNAALKLADFTQNSIDAAKTQAGGSWTFTNITGDASGVFTSTDQQGYFTSSEDWTTCVGGNRTIWSAIVTVDGESLLDTFGTGFGYVIQQDAGAPLGIGYTDGKAVGSWQGGANGNTVNKALNQCLDGAGNITLGIIYKGNNGCTIYVMDSQENEYHVDNGNLKGGYSTDLHPQINLTPTAGIEYKSLYVFGGSVSDTDMKAMMKGLIVPPPPYLWSATGETAVWDTLAENWTLNGEKTPYKSAADTIAIFSDSSEVAKSVTVGGEISVGTMKVQDNYTFTIGEGHSLTAGQLAVAGDGSLALAGVGTMTVTNGVTVETGGSLSVGTNSTLKLGFATAGELLKTITGEGNVVLAVNTQLEGVKDQAHPVKTQATGTLTIDNCRLKLGKMSTTGSFENYYVDMTSFRGINLNNGTLWVHTAPSTLKNLTASGTSTIHIQDQNNPQGTQYLTLAGTTTVNAGSKLIFTGTWKAQSGIERLAGEGTLELNGPNPGIVNIGGGTIGQISVVNNNSTANITDNLALGGLSGTQGTVSAAKDLTFTGADTYSYTGTLSVGGQIKKTGAGSQTIGGLALYHTILAQEGTLVLSGTYEIKGITDGSINTTYVNPEGVTNPNGGFQKKEGTIDVYSDSGSVLNRESAVFTYNGATVTDQVIAGKYALSATIDKSTVYVKSGSLAIAAYKQDAGDTLTTVQIADGGTAVMDTELSVALQMEEGASGTVSATKDITLTSVTGLDEGETLTFTAAGHTIAVQGDNTFMGNIVVDKGTVKLASDARKRALGEYNGYHAAGQPAPAPNKTITINTDGTIDLNGKSDLTYVYTLNGGSLVNNGGVIASTQMQTVGIDLQKDSYIGGAGNFYILGPGYNKTTVELNDRKLTKTGSNSIGFMNTAVSSGTIEVQAGNIEFLDGKDASTKANIILNGGTVSGVMKVADDISITAQQTTSIASELKLSVADSKTVSLEAATEKELTFGNGLVLTSGKAEVSGIVNVSGKSLDLSNGGNSTGVVNVLGDSVLNVNNGMWMAEGAHLDVAEGGVVNIAGLQIVGTGDGGITTSAENVPYSTTSTDFTITGATVTSTGDDVTLGNTLSGVDVFVAEGSSLTLNTNADSVTVRNGGTFTLNEGKNVDNITVENGGTIAGGVDATDVTIKAGATAIIQEGVSDVDNGVYIYSFEGADPTITNNGESDAQYAGLDQDENMTVTAETLYSTAADYTVVSGVAVTSIMHDGGELTLAKVIAEPLQYVDVEAGALTLQNITEVSLKELSIGTSSTVAVYTDDMATTEGSVTITETLAAGSATLLANLTIEDKNLQDTVLPLLDVNGGGDNALTLGSQFGIVEGTIVSLDEVTIAAIEGMKEGDSLALIKAGQAPLTYLNPGYDGMDYGQLFQRTEGMLGNYVVYANGDAFGVTKQGAVPEPTTGTLSLLALMALAARRRRK